MWPLISRAGLSGPTFGGSPSEILTRKKKTFSCAPKNKEAQKSKTAALEFDGIRHACHACRPTTCTTSSTCRSDASHTTPHAKVTASHIATSHIHKKEIRMTHYFSLRTYLRTHRVVVLPVHLLGISALGLHVLSHAQSRPNEAASHEACLITHFWLLSLGLREEKRSTT